MSNPTYKITTFQNVPFAGSCKLVDDKLTTNSNAEINFPSSGGTLATSSDIDALSNTYATITNLSALETKFGNLLNYLEAWISAGNLSMADIKTAVNGSGSGSE